MVLSMENLSQAAPGVRAVATSLGSPNLAPRCYGTGTLPPEVEGDGWDASLAEQWRDERAIAVSAVSRAEGHDEKALLAEQWHCERLHAGAFAWLPKNPRLARLAKQIRSWRNGGLASPPRCPSGWSPLDGALGGGFVTAALLDFIAPVEGAAAWTVALRVAGRAAAAHCWVLYVDMPGDLCPPALQPLGVPLERLLVARAGVVCLVTVTARSGGGVGAGAGYSPVGPR